MKSKLYGFQLFAMAELSAVIRQYPSLCTPNFQGKTLIGAYPHDVSHFKGRPLSHPSLADVPDTAYRDWDTTYVPAIGTAIESSHFLTGQLFNVTKAALDPTKPSTAVETALSVLFYSIWGTNDISDVAGGQPYGNVFTWYTGSSRDFALNRGVERVRSDHTAVEYLKDFYQPTGRLSRPLVTLHTTLDGQVPFSHEVRYLAQTVLSGKSRFLTVLPVSRYGHCNFTRDEILGAFGLMILKSSLR